MRIFVTGSGGLVGHNIVDHPAIADNELLTPRSKELDLLDFNAVFSYIKEKKPDLIIHCAGKVGGIQANMRDMYGFYTENAIIGINLIKSAKECGVEKLINLSSSCTYPRDYIQPLKEEYTLKAELEPTNEGYALAHKGLFFNDICYSVFCRNYINSCIYG